MREDAPINVKGWQPENYSHQYFGPVTLTRALSLSLNTVAVRLCVEVGPKAVVATAHRLGIVSELSPNASIALGTSEVSPLELVSAYAPFANGGIGVQPHVIERVKTAAGRLLYQRKGVSNGRVVDAAYLPMMNAMMQETLLTGTARKGEVPGWQAAGKTGTSQDWRDAWFVGYTSRLVTGVWLGNDDSSPTKKASGGNLPVEIPSRYMRVAHEGVPPQPLPGGFGKARRRRRPAGRGRGRRPWLRPLSRAPRGAGRRAIAKGQSGPAGPHSHAGRFGTRPPATARAQFLRGAVRRRIRPAPRRRRPTPPASPAPRRAQRLSRPSRPRRRIRCEPYWSRPACRRGRPRRQ